MVPTVHSPVALVSVSGLVYSGHAPILFQASLIPSIQVSSSIRSGFVLIPFALALMSSGLAPVPFVLA